MARVPGRWYAGCRTVTEGKCEILFETEYEYVAEAREHLANDVSLTLDDFSHWTVDECRDTVDAIRAFRTVTNSHSGSWTIGGYTYYLILEETVLVSSTYLQMTQLRSVT